MARDITTAQSLAWQSSMPAGRRSSQRQCRCGRTQREERERHTLTHTRTFVPVRFCSIFRHIYCYITYTLMKISDVKLLDYMKSGSERVREIELQGKEEQQTGLLRSAFFVHSSLSFLPSFSPLSPSRSSGRRRGVFISQRNHRAKGGRLGRGAAPCRGGSQRQGSAGPGRDPRGTEHRQRH